jgi:glucose-1-phosphate thymidylyltransferase
MREKRKPMRSAMVTTAIVPCAGLASRLKMDQKSGLYAKELLPIAYRIHPKTREAFPIPVIHASLEMIREAGISRCIIVTSGRKPELAAYLGDGSDFGLSFAYVRQDAPLGLADAVNRACTWSTDGITCVVLPDTIVRPKDALGLLVRDLQTSGADVMLGVFPTDIPEQLGPVDLGDNGVVRRVLEKPQYTGLRNTWGMAAWGSRFSRWMGDELARLDSPEKPALSVGNLFDLAIAHGMRVEGRFFPDGSYLDTGTPSGFGLLFERPQESVTVLPMFLREPDGEGKLDLADHDREGSNSDLQPELSLRDEG